MMKLSHVITGLMVVILIYVLATPVARLISTINPATALIATLRRDVMDLNNKNKEHLEAYTKLQLELSMAQTLSTTKEGELAIALQRVDKLLGSDVNLRATIDSLRGKLSQVSEGSGTVIIQDSGRLIDGRYTDDWVDIEVFGRSLLDSQLVYDSLGYRFNFGIGDVRVDLTDVDNNVQTVYSVWIQSKKNPTVRRYLDDYVVNSTFLKSPVVTWRWWDPRAILMYQVLGTPQIGLGMSILSYSPGGQAEGANLLRLPVISIVSNMHDRHTIGATVDLNIGYFTPIIQDVHGGIGYGLSASGHGQILLIVATTI